MLECTDTRYCTKVSGVTIIFITAHVNETVECLFKPFSEEELLEALEAALRTP
jgi:DNA-binding response OmpR family regulator